MHEAPAGGPAGASLPTWSSSTPFLLEEEGVEVCARVRGLEEVPASPLRDELTLVAVVVRRPWREVLGDHDVEIAVRLVARRTDLLVRSSQEIVHLAVVEVREVVVVVGVDVGAVQQDV